MSLIALRCPECREERLFEPPHTLAACPERADSPDGLCPELACVDCGTALLVGSALPITVSTQSITVGPQHGPVRAA